MRSSIALTTLLAIGAIAKPIQHKHKRYIVTEVDLDVVTVTKIVTAGNEAPAATAAAQAVTPVKHEHQHAQSSHASAAPSQAYTQAPQLPASSSSLTPAPAPTKAYTAQAPPASSSSKAAATSGGSYSGVQHKSGTSQADLSSGPDYQAAVLYHHNAARANHDAEPLEWSDECAANALKAAQRCDFSHYIPEGSGQGQNLFTVSGDKFNATAGITESWYKGEFPSMLPYYGQSDLPDDTTFEKVGHLTQLVWKGTKQVGCVSYDCKGKMLMTNSNGVKETTDLDKFLVCNYAPAGNIKTEYAQNVAKPKSTTNLGSWTD